MQYLRCKCGKRTRWSSMGGGRDCEGCPECQTTYSNYPDFHRDLVPHEWRPSYDERTAEVKYRVCDGCGVSDMEEAHR